MTILSGDFELICFPCQQQLYYRIYAIVISLLSMRT